jgi:hypothetical protein
MQAEAHNIFEPFSSLPLHLQSAIFAAAAAPLNTCKASAAAGQDASLVAMWLLGKCAFPFLRAAKYQLWDVCTQLLDTYEYTFCKTEHFYALQEVARQGQTGLTSSLLQWSCAPPCEECCLTCTAVRRALPAAAANGHVSVCRALVHHPAVTAEQLRNALYTAAHKGQVEVMQFLMSSSSPDSSSPALKGSPMCLAAYAGHIEAMKMLVQHGASAHNLPGEKWSSGDDYRHPVVYAAWQGHAEAVRWLLDQGTSAGHLGEALRAAAGGGHTDVTRLLLNQGLNISMVGPPAFIAAMEGGKVDTAVLLLEAGSPTDRDTLMTIANLGAAERVAEWVGAAVGRMGTDQSAALLQAAVRFGHIDFAEMLKEAGLAVPGAQAPVQQDTH